jgi:hypothetical protein
MYLHCSINLFTFSYNGWMLSSTQFHEQFLGRPLHLIREVSHFTHSYRLITHNIAAERYTLWSTRTFQRCSLRHITGHDVSTATKAITNATIVYKSTMLTMQFMQHVNQAHSCNNVLLGVTMSWKTRHADTDGSIRCSSLTLKRKEYGNYYHKKSWKQGRSARRRTGHM